jgi:hypothetical protein
MKTARALTHLTVLAFALAASVDSAAARNDDLEDAFAWFGTLELPTVRDRPFIRVTTVEDRATTVDELRPITVEGVLVSEDEKSFRMLTTQLRIRRFVKDAERQSYERIPLEVAARKLLESSPVDTHRSFSWFRRYNEDLSRAECLFFLAYVCDQNGMSELARALVPKAELLRRRRSGEATLKQVLGRRLASLMMARALDDFKFLAVNRREILTQMRWIDRNLRKVMGDRLRKQLDEALSVLSVMVEEDKRRDNAKRGSLADLVFRLRDQNGWQVASLTGLNIFHDPRRDQSPAHQLLARGVEAVPILINAVDDRRFTRSVAHGRFDFDPHVLRVGDCAQDILIEMNLRAFDGVEWNYLTELGSEESADPEELARLKSDLRARWEEFGHKDN